MVNKSTDIQNLQSIIHEIDSLSQSGFSQIAAVSRMAIKTLESGAYADPTSDVIEVFKMIWSKAEDVENYINAEAEAVGCNHTSKRLQYEINKVLEANNHD